MPPNPRASLAQIAGLYGYDPATVLSVWITPDEVVFRHRVATDSGRYQLVDTGFLITNGVRVLLEGLVATYGYSPGTVVRVCIDQRESVVRYLAPLLNGAQTILVDTFVIPDPVIPPDIADTDTGAAPDIPGFLDGEPEDILGITDEVDASLTLGVSQ